MLPKGPRARLLQFPARAGRSDTAKAIADLSPDGVVVTDSRARIVYANAAYRALSGEGELRPVERVFAGSPDVSELVYRLSQAAKSGKSASEDLRLAPPLAGDGAVAWYRIRVRPLEGVTREGASVWTVSDETREHDRHETFFQDLQHAIDYLDHAPAGLSTARRSWNGATCLPTPRLAASGCWPRPTPRGRWISWRNRSPRRSCC